MRSILLTVALLSGCQSVVHPPIAEVAQVDLARFMGDWYVIAATPTLIDPDAHNAVESDYQHLLQFASGQGDDVTHIRKIPQRGDSRQHPQEATTR